MQNMARAESQPVEARLVAEYLAVRFPNATTRQHVRLGPIKPFMSTEDLTPAERALAGVWRRWADAVVIEDTRVVIVEGSVYPDPGLISQLDLYLRLWPATPEYAQYARTPVVGLLLTALDDPTIRQLAAERGHLCAVYRPPWADGYLLTQYARRQRSPTAGL